jgi:hypothetical protein
MMATQIASMIQYQIGTGSRSAAALAGAAVPASAAGSAAAAWGFSASFSSSTLARPVICSSGETLPVSIVRAEKSDFSTGAVAIW